MASSNNSERKETYPKEVWKMIVDYAERYSELSNLPLSEVIRDRTPIHFFIGNYTWENNLNSEFSQEFQSRIKKGEGIADVVFEMQNKNYKKTKPEEEWFGCFSYRFMEDKKTGDPIIKLHFRNADETGFGPLAYENIEYRKEELKNMFENVKKRHPETKWVRGGSWTYNYDSYCRLFPKSYTKDMQSIQPQTHYMIIWGQFINSERELNEELARRFYEKLDSAQDIEELSKCFRYKELHPIGDIGDFYKFYKVENPLQ